MHDLSTAYAALLACAYTDTPQSEDAQVRAAVRAGVVAGPKGEEVGT